MERLLLIVCVLMYLAFLAARFSQRLHLPMVTSFLLLGIAVGPEGLNLVSTSMNQSLRIVEPIALGMITFAGGERIHFADICLFRARHYWAVVLQMVLPVLLVGVGAWLLTGGLQVALPLGTIAGLAGLATVVSTLKESRARGDYSRLLVFATAGGDFLAILAFSLVLPLAAWVEIGGSVGALYMKSLTGMAASVAIGFVVGFLLSRVIKSVRSSQELSMFVLAHVLVMSGFTYYFGFSVLLAGLTMGTTTANRARNLRNRERAFTALDTLEFPVIAIFFLWAGANLHPRALPAAGILFVVYLVARTIGKMAGPLALAWGFRKDEADSRRFCALGISLLPQASAARSVLASWPTAPCR